MYEALAEMERQQKARQMTHYPPQAPMGGVAQNLLETPQRLWNTFTTENGQQSILDALLRDVYGYSDPRTAMEEIRNAVKNGGDLPRPDVLGFGMGGITTPASKAAGEVGDMLRRFRRAEQDLGMPPEMSQWLLTNKTNPSGIAPGEVLPVRHYSTQQNPDVLRGVAYGSNWAGAERGRLSKVTGEPVANRVMFYTGDRAPESGVGANLTEMNLPGMYNMREDAEGFYRQARGAVSARSSSRQINPGAADTDEVMNIAETLMRDAGYRGAYDPKGGWGFSFEDIDLRPGAIDTLHAREQLQASMRNRELPANIENLGRDKEVGRALKGGPYYNPERYGATGQYKGYPEGVDTPAKYGAFQKGWNEKVEAGKGSRMWYDESSATMNRLTGGNIGDFLDMATSMGPTSKNTPVRDNWLYGVEGLYQRAAGHPVRTGMYPGPMAAELQQGWADPFKMPGQRKVTGYRNSFLRPMIPEVPKGVVADVWMSRGSGFDTPAFTPLQTDAIERTMSKSVDKMNQNLSPWEMPWDESQAQAAGWTTTKARWEDTPLDKAGVSMMDMAEQSAGHMPYEARPGESFAAQHPILSLENQPLQQQYFHDVNRMLTDDYGRNIIDVQMGLFELPSMRGQGVWGSQYNPNSVGRPVMRTAYGDVSDASRELLDASAIAKAILLDQDGASWFSPMMQNSSLSKMSRNAREFQFDVMPPEFVSDISKRLDQIKAEFPEASSIVPVPTEHGVMVVGTNGGSDKLQKALDNLEGWVKDRAQMYGYGYRNTETGKVVSNYVEKQDYAKAISEFTPKVQDRLREVVQNNRPAIQYHMQHYNQTDPALIGRAMGGRR